MQLYLAARLLLLRLSWRPSKANKRWAAMIINKKDADGWLAVQRALLLKDEDDILNILDTLHKHGLDPHTSCNRNTAQPFMSCAQRDAVRAAEKLLGIGYSIQADACSDSLLSSAAREGHKKIAAFFIEHGIDVNASDDTGATAAHWAYMMGHIDVGDYIATRETFDENATDDAGKTAAEWRLEMEEEEEEEEEEEDCSTRKRIRELSEVEEELRERFAQLVLGCEAATREQIRHAFMDLGVRTFDTSMLPDSVGTFEELCAVYNEIQSRRLP